MASVIELGPQQLRKTLSDDVFSLDGPALAFMATIEILFDQDVI